MFFEDFWHGFDDFEAGSDENPGNGPAEGYEGNEDDEKVSEKYPGKIEQNDDSGSVVEVSPELVSLGSDTVLAVFDFSNGGIELVVDDGVGAVDACPALDNSPKAEV